MLVAESSATQESGTGGSMKATGRTIATVGVAMFVAGMGLPFLVGTLIPPTGYSILQLGGLAVALVGGLMLALAGKGK